jgi:hypothetical protein
MLFLDAAASNVSLLAMFGNEMSVNPEVDVQNAHETMHELTHLNESNDSREIGILSFKMIHLLRS